MGTNCICSYCKKDIYKSNYAIKNHKQHFCNKECHNKYIKRINRCNVLVTNCDFCNKKIEKTKNQQKNSKTGLFFCDNICKNKFLANKRRWLKDNVKSHQTRRRFLLEKANNTCQQCGYNEDKRMLDVHHYDHNHKNNNNENLRVLCSWCHTKHHRLKIEYILPILIFQEEIDKKVKDYQNNRKKLHLRKKESLKICNGCHKTFKTSDNKKKYCSIDCYNLSKRKVKDRPSKETLLKELKESSYCAVGRKYGVSDNAIRKWLK